MRILVTWSGWRNPRRSWEWLTAEALKKIGHEVHMVHTIEKIAFEPDVIFSTSNAVLAMHYARAFRKPYVCWLIAGFPEGARGTEAEEALANADLLLAVSETAKQDFLKSFPREVEVHVAYHGVLDGREFVGEPERDLGFCFIGDPADERKRFSWFAEAVNLAGVPARIISPNPVKELKGLSVAQIYTAVDDRTKFELLAKSMGLIISSSWETFALHAAESASVETPVISADLPVIREIWGDSVLYGSNPDELAWRIFELLEDPKLGEKKGKEMRKIFDEKGLDLISCAKRLTRFFTEVVS